MKTHWKISIVCFQLLLVLGCSLGTQATVKTDQFDEGTAAYQAGNYQKALELFKPFAEQGDAKAQNTIWGSCMAMAGECRRIIKRR